MNVNDSSVTREKVVAAFAIVAALGATIRDAREIPAGTLYAASLSVFSSVETFNVAVGLLVKAGLVTRDSSHVLRWIGPKAVLS